MPGVVEFPDIPELTGWVGVAEAADATLVLDLPVRVWVGGGAVLDLAHQRVPRYGTDDAVVCQAVVVLVGFGRGVCVAPPETVNTSQAY